MRTNNRLAVGSPAARVAAIMAATLLAAVMIIGAGIAGASLLAADGPIVVDQSGDGDYTTIQEAVDAADDGDEILVRPGTYAEDVVIEKDVRLRGDGPVDEVVIEKPDTTKYGVTLVTLLASDSEVADITLQGDENTTGMEISGGAPTISGVVFDSVGAPYSGPQLGNGGSLIIAAGSAHVVDSRFVNGGEVMVSLDANAVFENNDFIDGPHLYLQDPGDEAVVRGNTFSGTFDRAMGLYGESTMIIEGNTIDGAGGDGISIGHSTAAGHDPLIRDNDISGTKVGIDTAQKAGPAVVDNRLHDNEIAIQGYSDSASYTGNELSGSDIGIKLRGSPTLDGNSVEDGRVGILVFGADSIPLMKNNAVCGNEQNVVISALIDTPLLEYDETNEICEDAPAE